VTSILRKDEIVRNQLVGAVLGNQNLQLVNNVQHPWNKCHCN